MKSIRRWQNRFSPLIRFVASSERGPAWEADKTYTFNVLFCGFIPLTKWNVRVVGIDDETQTLALEECGGPVRSWRRVFGPYRSFTPERSNS